MKRFVVNTFFYFVALFFVFICSLVIRITPPDMSQGIAVVFLLVYYGSIISIAKSKNHGAVVWVLAATLLTPFIGYLVIYANKVEKVDSKKND